MKKNLAKKVTLSILAGAVLMSSSVVWASEITTLPNEDGWSGYVISGTNVIIAPDGNGENNAVMWKNKTYDLTSSIGFGFTGVATGFSFDNDVENNSITMVGGELKASAGYTLYGGYSDKGNAIGNKVVLDGAKVIVDNSGDVASYWNVMGGRSGSGNASNNEVTIKNTTEAGFKNIYGGQATSGSAVGNTVNIASGNFNSSSIYGGYGKENAKSNTVNISGGNFTGYNNYIIGGYGANAEGNTVNISGGTFANVNSRATVYGGVVQGDLYATVKNNTINVSGDVDLSVVKLYGAGVHYENANGIFSYDAPTSKGNKLNIDGWSGSVNTVQYFNNINFENVEWDSEASDAVMKVTLLSFEPDTTVTVGDMTNDIGNNPEVGEEVTLIETIIIDGTLQESTSKFKIGSFLRAQGKIYQDDTKINLELTKVSANEQILAVGESRASASALTNQGSELIETGLDALARDNDKDTKVFAALNGNASEYETGSHVKVNGWNGIVGVGKTNANGVTMGAFFENGEGNYRTFNEYEGDLMRGDGEATYNGGGFLYRKDNASGVYTEASLRAGNLQNELRNVAIAGDELAGYDIDTFYYGAHVGVGKVIPRGNEGDSIDVYGKFIYTHYDDEDFTIDGGKFHLDSIESERLRLGFRINEVQNNKLNMYYGAAWEYEFGGDSNNAVVGYDVDVNAPSLGGSTVIGEIGAHYKASDKWSIDLNGRAYVGQREGFSGSVQANYAF